MGRVFQINYEKRTYHEETRNVKHGSDRRVEVEGKYEKLYENV